MSIILTTSDIEAELKAARLSGNDDIVDLCMCLLELYRLLASPVVLHQEILQ